MSHSFVDKELITFSPVGILHVKRPLRPTDHQFIYLVVLTGEPIVDGEFSDVSLPTPVVVEFRGTLDDILLPSDLTNEIYQLKGYWVNRIYYSKYYKKQVTRFVFVAESIKVYESN